MHASLLLVALLTSDVVVEAHLSEGQRRTGKLRQLSSDGIELSTEAGEVVHVPRGRLKILDFGSAETERPAARGVLRLSDGSRITFQTIELNGETVRVRSDSRREAWESPAQAVQTIRWISSDKTDQQWNEIVAKDETSDLLVIRRAQGTLDYLKGVVLSITDEVVNFEFSSDSVPVPLPKVAGVILYRKPTEAPHPRLQLATRDGSRWLLQSAELAGDELAIESVGGVSRTLDIHDVTRIEFAQLNDVFITELEPSISFTPYFGSRQLDSSLEQLRSPRHDRSFDGLPLRVPDPSSPSGWRQYRHGLAIHSRTELVYRLAGQYRRFRATAGIDPLASSQGHVELIISGDGEPGFVREIGKEDQPVPIDIDVSGVRRLSVLVDFGENLDMGDRLHLGDARLTK